MWYICLEGSGCFRSSEEVKLTAFPQASGTQPYTQPLFTSAPKQDAIGINESSSDWANFNGYPLFKTGELLFTLQNPAKN